MNATHSDARPRFIACARDFVGAREMASLRFMTELTGT
jgi:hypothetical protein